MTIATVTDCDRNLLAEKLAEVVAHCNAATPAANIAVPDQTLDTPEAYDDNMISSIMKQCADYMNTHQAAGITTIENVDPNMRAAYLATLITAANTF